MDLFVIYENPKDYPNKFVVRQWRVLELGITQVAVEPLCVVDTLDEARKLMLEKQLFRMAPCEGDDPVIKEVWL